MTSSASQSTIDVVIPVYNGASFVLQAIQSVAAQTLAPHAIIVVDDGSTDATPDVLCSYNGAVPLQVIRQDNHGLSAARNAGWKHSQAELIAFLDADDIWMPEKLAAQVAVFRQAANDKLALVYCDYHLIDSDGKVTTPTHLPIVHPRLRGQVLTELLAQNVISGSGSGVLIRRNVLEATGGFDESLRALEDWDMWLRIAEDNHIDFVDQDLVAIRTHAAGMQRDTPRMMTATIDFYSRWLERLPATVEPPKIWIRTLARYAGSSWPPGAFWTLLQTHMSSAAKRRLQAFLWSKMKLYTAFRSLSLPFELLIRRPWRQRMV